MKATLLVLVLVLAIAASGCGGGGALSKAEYGKKLTAICRDYNAQARQIGAIQSITDLRTRGQQLADAFQRVLDRAQKLKPPDELMRTTGRFLLLGRALHDKLVAMVAAAKKGNGTALALAQREIERLGKEWNDIARMQLTAPACVQGGAR